MNISSVANLDEKTVVLQLQNFITLQMKVDILYLELVKTVYTKNPDLPHLGQCFSLILKIWIHEIKTIQ